MPIHNCSTYPESKDSFVCDYLLYRQARPFSHAAQIASSENLKQLGDRLLISHTASLNRLSPQLTSLADHTAACRNVLF
jgi:hypothetical protein